MENCFVTKLKVACENSNLKILGNMQIKAIALSTVSDASTQQKLMFQVNAASVISVDGDGYFATSLENLDDPSSRLTSKELATSGWNTLYFKNGTYNININNKYAVTVFSRSGSGDFLFNFDLDDFAYSESIFNLKIPFSRNSVGDIKCLSNKPLSTINVSTSLVSGDVANLNNLTDINTIDLTSTKVSGNISAFNRFTTLTSLTIASCPNLTGDISSLASLVLLTTLSAKYSFITGDVESLIGSMASNRSSGTISLRLEGSTIKYNNTSITSALTARFGSSMVNPTAAETAQGWQIS